VSILTLDIGGTKIAAALVSDGVVSSRQSVPTPAREGADAVLGRAAVLARSVCRDAGPADPVTALGVSCAGVVDSERGVVVAATDLIAGWAGTAVADRLAGAFGVPAWCLNDVHAHALGEARHGAGRHTGSMLLVAIGTGIGGAHVLDGSVVAGAHHAAGHVGHVHVALAGDRRCSCGRRGHLEAIASGSAMLTAYRERGGVAADGADLDAAAAIPGPPGEAARAVLATAGRATGIAIGSLLNVLDPEVVVLSGGVVGAGAPWLEPLRAGVRESALDALADTPVVLAQTGADAPHLGAAAFVRERMGAGGSGSAGAPAMRASALEVGR